MFDKILDFYYNYEELINFSFILFSLIFILCSVIKEIDISLIEEKNIIENTKDYAEFDSCKKIDDSWYCWNENKK